MDTLTPATRSERMSRVRGKNTGPELTVRRLIHALGYRFPLHRRDLPGTTDLSSPASAMSPCLHAARCLVEQAGWASPLDRPGTHPVVRVPS